MISIAIKHLLFCIRLRFFVDVFHISVGKISAVYPADAAADTILIIA
jgi:hypothetical protein